MQYSSVWIMHSDHHSSNNHLWTRIPFQKLFFSWEENKGDNIKMIKGKHGWSNQEWEHSKWISSWYLTSPLHSFIMLISSLLMPVMFNRLRLKVSVSIYNDVLELPLRSLKIAGHFKIIFKMLFAYLYHRCNYWVLCILV